MKYSTLQSLTITLLSLCAFNKSLAQERDWCPEFRENLNLILSNDSTCIEFAIDDETARIPLTRLIGCGFTAVEGIDGNQYSWWETDNLELYSEGIRKHVILSSYRPGEESCTVSLEFVNNEVTPRQRFVIRYSIDNQGQVSAVRLKPRGSRRVE
ncbi:MAG: hypothetical protein HWD92_11995 [Flavobacteriia bacterium]|nr:hypothetical protein [Flavobacteriia bacterium]